MSPRDGCNVRGRVANRRYRMTQGKSSTQQNASVASSVSHGSGPLTPSGAKVGPAYSTPLLGAEKDCEHCGRSFRPARNGRFCSSRCRSGAYRGDPRPAYDNRKCQGCGAPLRPELTLAQTYCRRECRSASAPSYYGSTPEWLAILRRDPCAYCGGQAGSVDHIQARGAGGEEADTNLTGSCAGCNHGKTIKPLLHFLLALNSGRPPKRGSR